MSTNYSYLYFISEFECGFCSALTSLSNFSIGFLRLLVFFVLLDVEVVLFLNAVNTFLSLSVYFYYFFFLVIVLLGFFYEIYWGFIRFN
uniref:NADH-ubiquinone oxidoreductase chain 3 n=1 Tax=Polylabris halichoeres TaxID=1004784 RepID=G3F9Z2_POLHA|nr:NADH dehydrogenase subunit 3 [Polylabris halichoeres]AEB55014.1 NADH dehydrogenase subunit 3 [Polylabris halichoeres]